MNQETFRKQCQEAEGDCIGIYFSDAEHRKTKVVEDDGALIVCRAGLRAVFGLNQDAPLRTQNERIEAVLTALKLEKFLPDALHSKESIDEEEDDSCPHCGGSVCQ